MFYPKRPKISSSLRSSFIHSDNLFRETLTNFILSFSQRHLHPFPDHSFSSIIILFRRLAIDFSFCGRSMLQYFITLAVFSAKTIGFFIKKRCKALLCIPLIPLSALPQPILRSQPLPSHSVPTQRFRLLQAKPPE